MKRILVIEDDWNLNQGICYALQKEKYALCSAHSIKEAKEIYQKEDIDLILLDVNLPDGEGFSFCKWVKKQKEVPVLFLTARDLEEDALKGYELGAEDYVTKPFSMKILLKKINVILKRIKERNPFDFDDGFLKMNVEQAKVTVAGELCLLTPTEFRLLKLFIEHKGQLLTYEVLLDRLWDGNGQFVDKHTLAVNINRLRGKIEDEQHKYISNVYGMGYQWLG
ncbi:MAG: response regulator transcription factor [Lachnospiraceae bacterium]|nr:response regulator transcription factor [Lachnospiraceae bacterium]